ncbi:MAG: hypothetical protein ABWW70_05185 [Thermoproteota archaeon]
MPKVGGVDLAASPKRPSAVALFEKRGGAWTLNLVAEGPMSVEELAELLLAERPTLVAVDAPLLCPEGVSFRQVERQLMKVGGRVLPLTWPSMKALCLRARDLAARLLSGGIIVVETHPYSAAKLADCPLRELARRVASAAVEEPSKHIVDAVLSALVALCVVEACSLKLAGIDGTIYLAAPESCSRLEALIALDSVTESS